MDEYAVGSKKQQLAIMFAVFISVFMFSVDFSMMNISLPTIAKYFRVNIAAISWLPIIYILIVTGSLLGFGKLGDLKGYKPLFILGVSVFAAGSLLCAFCPNIYALAFCRAAQSLGEAMMSPIGIAILTTFLPSEKRGIALGLIALAQGAGFALGNILGGYINDHFIWRGIFLVNIPIAVFTVFLSLKSLPSKQRRMSDGRFDAQGSFLIFISLASALYAFNSLSSAKTAAEKHAIVYMAIFAAAAFVLFILRERRIEYPLLDLKLFRNKYFTFSNAAAFLMIAVLMGFIFIAPFYLEMVRGLKVMQAGSYLMIAPVMMLLLAPAAGRISDKIGSRPLCSAGALIGASSLAFLALQKADARSLYVAIGLALLGTAAGIFMAPNNKLVMAHAPEDRQGVASGVYKICLSVGSALGIALLPLAIMRSITALALAKNIAMSQVRLYPDIMQAGFRGAFVLGSALCITAFVFSVLAKDREEQSRH